jgi:ligand-binding sensor domain-containing protein
MAQFHPQNLVKHYSITQGLSQGVVNSIIEDQEHIIWFATEDGLNRFDGYSFKIFKYDQGSKNGLPDNFVQSLYKDSQDTLWISTRKGLLKFDPDVESFELYKHQFKNKPASTNDVSFITEGSTGNLWIAWYGSGLASFNKTTRKFTPYTKKELPSLSSTHTVALFEDKFSLLWVGTQDGGLSVFKVINGAIANKIEELSAPQNLPSLNVRSVVTDNENNIWIATSKGLTVYLRQQNKFYSFNSKQFPIADKSIF